MHSIYIEIWWYTFWLLELCPSDDRYKCVNSDAPLQLILENRVVALKIFKTIKCHSNRPEQRSLKGITFMANCHWPGTSKKNHAFYTTNILIHWIFGGDTFKKKLLCSSQSDFSIQVAQLPPSFSSSLGLPPSPKENHEGYVFGSWKQTSGIWICCFIPEDFPTSVRQVAMLWIDSPAPTQHWTARLITTFAEPFLCINATPTMWIHDSREDSENRGFFVR